MHSSVRARFFWQFQNRRRYVACPIPIEHVFWDNLCMSWGLWIDIEKCHIFLVLIDNMSRNFFGNDFAENAAFVFHRIHYI